jgi:hypothetical protein
MRVFAIGIEFPLMMAMDRLQHSHLSEDHRAAVLGPRVHPDEDCYATKHGGDIAGGCITRSSMPLHRFQ